MSILSGSPVMREIDLKIGWLLKNVDLLTDPEVSAEQKGQELQQLSCQKLVSSVCKGGQRRKAQIVFISMCLGLLACWK